MDTSNQLIYSWNPESSNHLLKTRIEDDSLRDGLQGAFVRKPTIEEKIKLVKLSSEVGVQSIMLGFPAISQREHQECQADPSQATAGAGHAETEQDEGIGDPGQGEGEIPRR